VLFSEVQLSEVTQYSLLFQLFPGFSPGFVVLFLAHWPLLHSLQMTYYCVKWSLKP